MKILNLVANEPNGPNQNIGDSFASLALKEYAKGKRDKWIVGNFHKRKFDLDKYGLVILGGGGLYNSGHLTKLFTDVNIVFSNSPLAIMGIGLNLDGGEKLNKKDNEKIIVLNKRAFVSTVRDVWSKSYLEKLGIKTSLTGCPSLFLPEVAEMNKSERYDIGLNFAMSHTSYYQKQALKVVKFIDRVARKLEGSKIIICHSKWEKKVYKDLIPGIEIFYSDKPKEVFGVYKACKMIIGMRGHSQIFALAVNTPSLAIPLNEKVAQPVKMIWEKSDNLLINLDDPLDKVERKILYLEKNYKKIKTEQKLLKEKLKINFYRAMETIEKVK